MHANFDCAGRSAACLLAQRSKTTHDAAMELADRIWLVRNAFHFEDSAEIGGKPLAVRRIAVGESAEEPGIPAEHIGRGGKARIGQTGRVDAVARRERGLDSLFAGARGNEGA
jgi:hypothetical protein